VCIAIVFVPSRRFGKRLWPLAATIAAMDPVDSEILRLLREDGRLSWRDLGAAVGLSANAAADRVRRLRRAGVITGFAALVDPAAGGRQLEALVGVTLAAGTDSDAFATAVSRLEPVTEVLHLAGAPDYQLRVSCRDTAELDMLLRALRLRAGAADTETTIILRSGPPPAE
jgi:Lrp/AsnC family transcriptional regulator, leucine-responsive regulatory protein